MDEITQKEFEIFKEELGFAQTLAGGKEALAAALGVSARTIDNWLAKKGIKPKNKEKLREFVRSKGPFEAMNAYAAMSMPSMFSSGSAQQKDAEDQEFIDVALREATGSMGGGSTETGMTIRQFLKFRKDWISSQTTTPTKLSCIKCFGDSMSPTVTDNSVVLIDEGRRTFSAGKVFYIRYDGSMYLKRLNGSPGDIYITSDNDPGNPIHVEESDDFEIIARAIWMGRLIE